MNGYHQDIGINMFVHRLTESVVTLLLNCLVYQLAYIVTISLASSI